MKPKNKEQLVRKPKTSGYKSPPYHWGWQVRDLPPFSLLTAQAMQMDPTIRLGLAMRAAPLCRAEFAYKEGEEWKPGIESSDPMVAAFVERNMKRIWQSDLKGLLESQKWGWAAAEVVYKQTSGDQVEIAGLLHRQANDCRVITQGGNPAGVRFLKVHGETRDRVDLGFPYCLWHAFRPEAGQFYGVPILKGCYSPWWDKWMDGGALDVRRLFMHKDAYGGVDVSYPDGYTEIPSQDGATTTSVPNRDIAREMAEQIKAGGVTTRPSDVDPTTGKERWTITRANVPANPAHILQYPKDLDTDILRGLEIPDDVLESTDGAGGAWAGKTVPQGAFYTGLELWLRDLIACIKTQVMDPLVRLNFGRSVWYEITTKPLSLQATEQQGKDKTPQAPPQFGGGNPLAMSLEAIGRGAIEAGPFVRAAKRVRRTRFGFDESEHPRAEDGKFGEKSGGGSNKEKKQPADKATKAAEVSKKTAELSKALGSKPEFALTRLKVLGHADTCGRCGGSGEYSFNARDGKTCYGCGGSGAVMPKITDSLIEKVRQDVADGKLQPYFDRLASVKASKKIGDKLLDDYSSLTADETAAVDATEGVRKHWSVGTEKGFLTRDAASPFYEAADKVARSIQTTKPENQVKLWSLLDELQRGMMESIQYVPEDAGTKVIKINDLEGTEKTKHQERSKSVSESARAAVKAIQDKHATDSNTAGVRMDASPKANPKSGGNRWVTIGGSSKGGKGEHHGGFPVQIDADGNILKGGPKGLRGKHVSEIGKHFEETREARRKDDDDFFTNITKENETAAKNRAATDAPGNTRSLKKIIAYQADKWGMDEETYGQFMDEIDESHQQFVREREAFKKAARERTNMDSRRIASVENRGGKKGRGGDSSSVKNLDTAAEDLAAQYPQFFDKGHDPAQQLYEMLKEGVKAAPARHSREFHDKVEEYLESAMANAGSSWQPEEVAEELSDDPNMMPFGLRRMSKDSSGHEHKGKGKGGGQFTSTGGGGAAVEKTKGAKPIVVEKKSAGSKTSVMSKPQTIHSLPYTVRSGILRFDVPGNIPAKNHPLAAALEAAGGEFYGGRWIIDDDDKIAEFVEKSKTAKASQKPVQQSTKTQADFKDQPGAYWRIHKGEFTPDDIHDSHKSKLWQAYNDPELDERATRSGLSVSRDLDTLAGYFAGRPGEHSPGRGATFEGSHLVQVFGDTSSDAPFEENYGESLIHPREIGASVPVQNTDFIDRIRAKIEERWGGKWRFDPTADEFVRIKDDDEDAAGLRRMSKDSGGHEHKGKGEGGGQFTGSGGGDDEPFSLTSKPKQNRTLDIPLPSKAKQKDLFAGRGDAPGQTSFFDDIDPAAKNVKDQGSGDAYTERIKAAHDLVKTLLGKGDETSGKQIIADRNKEQAKANYNPNQKRAKSGGEVGPNGEDYRAGAFIATTDMPKKVKAKIAQAAAGKVTIEPGKWGVPDPGQLSILDAIGGTYFNHRDGSVNEQFMEHQRDDDDKRKQVNAAAKAYREGKRLVSVTEFPRLAKYGDLARMMNAEKPIPGELVPMAKAIFGATFDKYKPNKEAGKPNA